MKKYFYLFVLAFLPMCFIACGGDDDEVNPSGLTTKNLIGDWIIIESGDGRSDGANAAVRRIWSFNSDGTFYDSRWGNEIYSKWEVSNDKLLMTRTNGGTKEAYFAEIKDGKLYTRYDGEWKIFERVNKE